MHQVGYITGRVFVYIVVLAVEVAKSLSEIETQGLHLAACYAAIIWLIINDFRQATDDHERFESTNNYQLPKLIVGSESGVELVELTIGGTERDKSQGRL